MLCVNTYKKDDVDECGSRIESQLTAYKVLAATAREKTGTANPAWDSAVGVLFIGTGHWR